MSNICRCRWFLWMSIRYGRHLCTPLLTACTHITTRSQTNHTQMDVQPARPNRDSFRDSFEGFDALEIMIDLPLGFFPINNIISHAHKQTSQNSGDDNKHCHHFCAYVTHVTVLWQTHAAKSRQTSDRYRERQWCYWGKGQSCHTCDRIMPERWQSQRDNGVMKKEPVMTESQRQRCLSAWACHVKSACDRFNGKEPVVSPVQVRVMSLTGLSPQRHLHLGGAEDVWPSIL